MASDLNSSIFDPRVSIARVPNGTYDVAEIDAALRNLCNSLGWAASDRGSFGQIIPPGSNVVVKPNLVLHENRGKGGLLELITNAALIKAVVQEAVKAEPSQIIVGDAPIQSCDFEALMDATGLGSWAAELQETEPSFGGILDFRRTVSQVRNGVRYAQNGIRPVDDYVLYNLGRDSLLEPISDEKRPFRVTCYDPRLLERTHSPGNHQYLVAREVIDADIVINLPKLKTHKKAGITNALKNLVGINGNKEYLPHHRIGGSDSGGDCYPGRDPVKRMLEVVLDKQNSASTRVVEKAMSVFSENLHRLARLRGDEIGVEGSWSGNETVARMTLDLNRVLLYGKPDGSLGDDVQRNVIHICDAVVAGQGDGPLASERLELGLLLASRNPAAMDQIGARFLGYDPAKVPLLNHAFEEFRWPVANFDRQEVILTDADRAMDINENELAIYSINSLPVRHPAGWRAAAA